MKLACASSALHRTIERGDLTQLEFLDLCAQELGADGVALDVRHFPRSDDEYLAQVKKMAADRGLSIAVVTDAAFFSAAPERMEATLRHAVAVGAPLVAAPLAAETAHSWSEQLTALGTATSLAKRYNVTLAVRNALRTFAGTLHDCKRVAKETDSAWLRFGPEPRALDAASDPSALAANSVLLWSNVGDENERSVGDVIRGFAQFRGHLALDEPSGDATVTDMQSAMRSWRIALASIALNRT
jgi:sugar phosphate isomerase/epimerase